MASIRLQPGVTPAVWNITTDTDPHVVTHRPHTLPRSRCACALLVLAQVAILYVGAVFAGGRLIASRHPTAQRVGVALHTITMINPAIRWSDTHGHDTLTRTLLALADAPRTRRAI